MIQPDDQQPFKTNLVNASYLIASALPPSFTFASDPSHAGDGSTHPPRRISLHVHPSPILVAYSSVRATVPAILEEYASSHGGRRPDIIIHMGIASTRRHYSVETQAHRDSYTISDVKGRLGWGDGERLWTQLGLPPVLAPGPASEGTVPDNADSQTGPVSAKRPQVCPRVPDDHLISAWKSFCPSDTDVRLSRDAGRYLCEFIFYTSLALALQKGQDRNVVFFHVPASCEDEDIEKGKDVTIALIKALISSWIDGNPASTDGRS